MLKAFNKYIEIPSLFSFIYTKRPQNAGDCGYKRALMIIPAVSWYVNWY